MPPLSQWLTRVYTVLHPWIPPLNFITLHYLYFIITCLMTSWIFYLISTDIQVDYIDSLFLQVSAITEAGLNTVNLSQLNTVQQIFLFIQIIIGSAIWVSISVVAVRKHTFELRFSDLIVQEREWRRNRRNSISSKPNQAQLGTLRKSYSSAKEDHNGHSSGITVLQRKEEESTKDVSPSVLHGSRRRSSSPEDISQNDSGVRPRSSEDEDRHISFGPELRKRSLFAFTGVGASPVGTAYKRPGQMGVAFAASQSVERHRAEGELANKTIQEILTKDVTGRNSQFHSLSREERERLGGVEYRSLKLLAWVVPAYFVLCQLFGAVGIGAWMAYHENDVWRQNGINPWWGGAFNAVSAFNNSGMSLLDANMVAFQNDVYPVLTMGFLILAGNTAYPVFLRLVIWTVLKLTPKTKRFHDFRETAHFLLEHPRRVYTHLFPSTQTWWLLMTVIVLNCTDWVIFELLNIGNAVVEAIPTNYRIMDGLFQALAVRSGGFYIVPIGNIRIGVQVLYVVMMYISVYPIAVSLRNSNVYEERSLGIYAEHPPEQSSQDVEDEKQNPFGTIKRILTNAETPRTRSNIYFVRQQVSHQLSHDLTWLVIAILAIVSIESSSFETDPVTFSVFNVIFETVSAYGCVGISVGLPYAAYSFCGAWHLSSKLILCAVMLRGRHRGLPVEIDQAVMLPGQRLGEREEEDHVLKRPASRGIEGGGSGRLMEPRAE